MTASQNDSSNFLFVVAAASGTGKTSLVAALRERRPDLAVSVSHTTRSIRPGEIDGQNYYFVDHDAFVALQSADGFLESAEVFGHLYGTSLAEVDRIRESGPCTLLEIDWQGALQIKKKIPGAQLIFILPPSLNALRQRLTLRGQDSQDVIEHRLSLSVQEISQYAAFDFMVVNDAFEIALSQLEEIVSGRGETLKRAAQEVALKDLLASLLS